MRPAIFSRRSAIAAAMALGFIGVLTGCGGGGGGKTPTVNDITILPGTASVPQGGTAQFSAYLNGVAITASWQASGGTITSTGLFTAPTSGSSVLLTATSGSNSGTLTVNVVAAQPLTISPAAIALPAGQNFAFSALLNGQGVTASWSVSSPNGGNPGTIDGNGNYTPPLFPPPGQAVTVTATNGGNTGTSNVVIIYSNASLSQSYAFAYTGDDGSGFFTVAGSFTADGDGNIESGGLEDAEDLGGVNAQIPINGGTYTVGADGRTQINLSVSGSSVILEAALTTNTHGLLIRYDNVATGSGTIDQQNTADFNVTGPYVFTLSGADLDFDPLTFAGKFTSGGGTIPNTNAIVDVNDAGYVNGGNGPTEPDTSLSGGYAFTNVTNGRGTIYLNATNFGSFLPSGTQVQFAFYVIDHTHLHLVEIDGNAFTSGDAYSGLLGTGFPVSILPKGNNTFTLGGTSTQGAYSAAGVFASDGTGDVQGGVFANNSGGNPINKNLTINKCAFTVDPATGRIDLSLAFTSSCTTNATNVDEFAVYQTAVSIPTSISTPSAVMIEIDNNFVSSGLAYAQQQTPVAPTGSFAFNLTGQGIFHNTAGSYQQDALAQLSLSGTSVTSGNFNINNYGSVQSGPVLTGQSSLSGLSGSYGQGTMKLSVSISGSGTAVYNLNYYYVDPTTYLLIDLDSNRIATGEIEDQF